MEDLFDVNKLKYAYIVNPVLQAGQMWPTFTPLIKDPDGKWPRVSGQAVEYCYLYFTNKRVDPDDPHCMEEHIKSLRRGGPNVRKPDADDSKLLEFINARGHSVDAMEAALRASEELQAVMAADGHFKVELI